MEEVDRRGQYKLPCYGTELRCSGSVRTPTQKENNPGRKRSKSLIIKLRLTKVQQKITTQQEKTQSKSNKRTKKHCFSRPPKKTFQKSKNGLNRKSLGYPGETRHQEMGSQMSENQAQASGTKANTLATSTGQFENIRSSKSDGTRSRCAQQALQLHRLRPPICT